jgi:hypothetical protein
MTPENKVMISCRLLIATLTVACPRKERLLRSKSRIKHRRGDPPTLENKEDSKGECDESN